MAGQRVDAKTDMCLMDELELLLVQVNNVSCRISSSAWLTELLSAEFVK